ncbi:hypothetical protein JCM16358_08660 [Halanaerocella petrolearia]
MSNLWHALASIGGLLVGVGMHTVSRQNFPDYRDKSKIALIGTSPQLSHPALLLQKEEPISLINSNHKALWITNKRDDLLKSKVGLKVIQRFLATQKVVMFINNETINSYYQSNITDKSDKLYQIGSYLWQDSEYNINIGVIKVTKDTTQDTLCQLLLNKTTHPAKTFN